MKFWFEDSGEGKTAKLISVLLSKRPGNFLFVRKNFRTGKPQGSQKVILMHYLKP